MEKVKNTLKSKGSKKEKYSLYRKGDKSSKK